ncbi:MAG TPA: transglutaminase-like domain-containing protein, partial [Actinotalea sp.]|nr:transglutaminase-like domain-containing protein [Actinotalea sp.]
MSEERQGVRRGRRAVADVGVLTAALGLALLPLLPVYGAGSAGAAVVGGLALGAGVATLSAWRRWSALVTTAVALIAYVLLGGPLAAPTSMTGPLPSPATVGLLLSGLVTVWKQVLTLDPPLGQSGNLLAAPLLLALVGGLVAVSVALRAAARGAWAAVVPLLVLAVSVLLGTKTTVEPVAAGVALAVLLLPWAAWRTGALAARRVVSLTVMTAVVVTSGALAGPVLGEQRARFVLRDELVPPFDPQDQPSPLSSFRRFVRDWKDTDLLTVGGLPEGAVVRLATMDAFDGVVWNVAGAQAAEGSGQFRRVGETITTTVEGESATIDLEVHSLPFVWLPTVGWTERFDFHGPDALELAADLRYNDATGTAVLTQGVPDGTSWTAEVVVPEVPDEDEIGAAPVGSVVLPEPTGVPEAVPLYAGELAGSATTPVLIATSLADGLAERGWFSHGLTESGDHPSLSGHGADRLTTLLTGDLMVGDAEQYASAMALMAREMGLPARLVLGFVPAPDEVGADEVTVTGDDVDAWVEISFSGYGWVPFYPTPDESRTPTEDTPQQESEPQPQVRQPPPPPQDPVTPPDDDTEQPRTEDTEQDLQRDQTLRAVLTALGVAGIPLLLLGGPLVLVAWAKRRRRRRRRTQGPAVDRVVGGWDELLDHARDLRRPPPPRATRRETAVHLASAFAPVEGRARRGGASGPGQGGRRGGR